MKPSISKITETMKNTGQWLKLSNMWVNSSQKMEISSLQRLGNLMVNRWSTLQKILDVLFQALWISFQINFEQQFRTLWNSWCKFYPYKTRVRQENIKRCYMEEGYIASRVKGWMLYSFLNTFSKNVTCLIAVCLFVALTVIGSISQIMHKKFINVVQGNGTCDEC